MEGHIEDLAEEPAHQKQDADCIGILVVGVADMHHVRHETETWVTGYSSVQVEVQATVQGVAAAVHPASHDSHPTQSSSTAE